VAVNELSLMKRRRALALGHLPWVLPAAVVIVFVFGYSVFALFDQSFKYKEQWVGFENFNLVLGDSLFRTAIWHNTLLLAAVPVLVALGTALALALFEVRNFVGLYRTAIFLPYILPIPVVGVVFGQLLQFNGALNSALRALNLPGFALDWLGDPQLSLPTMGAIIIWKEVGFGAILILARLMSLPYELFEAARIDGCNFWQMTRRVTIPQLKTVLVFYFINEAIVMVSWVFNYVYVMTNGQGGPGDSTFVSELYIYREAFQNQAPELAAAAAVMLLVATSVLIVGLFTMQRKMSKGMFND
jgi:ABC-type sugar transport system permease subunit